MAGKRIQLNIAQIEALAGRGLTHAEICDVVGISPDTLSRRKRDDAEVAAAIQRGRSRSHAIVANALFELIKQGNLGAIIWYEKTRCGMTDKAHVTHAIEQPIQVEAYDYDSAIAVLAPPNPEA